MIGTGELIVILCVILILFGGKKLPEFAKNLGKGVREFKNACQGIEDSEDDNSKHCCSGKKSGFCKKSEDSSNTPS